MDNVGRKKAKVINNGYGVHFCDNCNGTVWQNVDESHYCFRCGSLLDWSDALKKKNKGKN